MELLSTREWATLSWIALLAIWLGRKRSVRRSWINVLRAVTRKKVLFILSAMAAYIAALCAPLIQLELWSLTQLKNVVYWYFGMVVVLAFGLGDSINDLTILRSFARESASLIVIIEFLSNLATFSFFAELIVVPIISVLAITSILGQYNRVDKTVGDTASIGLLLLLLALIVHSLVQAASHPSQYLTKEHLVSFFLPIYLAIGVIPFWFAVVIWAFYESLFARLQFFLKDSAVLQYAKWIIPARFGLRIGKVRDWERHMHKQVAEKGDLIRSKEALKKSVREMA